MKSFIETQFPVSLVSRESYKERKANLGQTLTGLGKWWGRKPLVLVRAAILGLLIPATDEPKKDMKIFLKLMTMDERGLLLRRKKNFTDEKWNALNYDEKLTNCVRPEEVTLTDPSEWKEINSHLKTNATSLNELINELSVKRFGKTAAVGDCFSGGGSVTFEAARLGCNVFASDLNPIAGLLSWANLNIAGADDEKIADLRKFQEKIYNAVDKQIIAWGIETNEQGDRANSYIYCVETTCPECGYTVPLAPSWIIGKGTMTRAFLHENKNMGFDIDIKSGCSPEEMKTADSYATVKRNAMHCPHCEKDVRIDFLRRNMRLWEKNDFVARRDDVFRERLYCIKYTGESGKRYYTAPTAADLQREEKTAALLAERFADWQAKGYIPTAKIEEGYNTSQLIRERGWQYWHQLFNARQLLVHGLMMENIALLSENSLQLTAGVLGLNKCCDWSSKISAWSSVCTVEKVVNTFSNQSLNTLFNYGCRAFNDFSNLWNVTKKTSVIKNKSLVKVYDARNISETCDIWITDPPYADAVNYHELSEFFLAWDEKLLKRAFPEWYTDSRRVLAVKGRDDGFSSAMVDIYTNLAKHMPDNGLQIIMFTHQDVNVWANLTNIVWSAGLQVTAAWNIATETESGGLKDGNYVKGTVLLVLRKQKGDKTAFLDEVMPEIEDEVKAQIRNMYKIDEGGEPNFSDADYILAAYAASLKVLTSYKSIEDIDVAYELSKEGKSSIAAVIENARKIAYDALIPIGFDGFIWRALSGEDRLYIKALETEKRNIYQLSAYQELARGYNVPEYKELMASVKANAARFKTPGEWANKNIGGEGFSGSLMRHILMALYLATKTEDNIMAGKNWLRNELSDYWNKRDAICEILSYIKTLEHITNTVHWIEYARTAAVLAELVKNDGV